MVVTADFVVAFSLSVVAIFCDDAVLNLCVTVFAMEPVDFLAPVVTGEIDCAPVVSFADGRVGLVDAGVGVFISVDCGVLVVTAGFVVAFAPAVVAIFCDDVVLDFGVTVDFLAPVVIGGVDCTRVVWACRVDSWDVLDILDWVIKIRVVLGACVDTCVVLGISVEETLSDGVSVTTARLLTIFLVVDPIVRCFVDVCFV